MYSTATCSMPCRPSTTACDPRISRRASKPLHASPPRTIRSSSPCLPARRRSRCTTRAAPAARRSIRQPSRWLQRRQRQARRRGPRGHRCGHGGCASLYFARPGPQHALRSSSAMLLQHDERLRAHVALYSAGDPHIRSSLQSSPAKPSPAAPAQIISPAKRARPDTAPTPSAGEFPAAPGAGIESDSTLDAGAQIRILQRTNAAMKEREKSLRAEVAVRSARPA